MTLGEWVVVILGSGTLGAILKSVVDWWLGRGDKRQEQEQRRHEYEQAIAKANDELSEQLRKELRDDREAYRERLRAAEDRISELVGQVQQLTRTNDTLRAENMALQKQAGQDTYRLNKQADTIADQALKLSALENDLVAAKDRIGVLEAALREKGVDVPDSARRRGDTGPLNPAGASA